MSIGDTLEVVSEFFAAALGPLAGSTESPESATALIEAVGWIDLPVVPPVLLDLQDSMQGLLEARANLIDARIAFSAGTGTADGVAAALTAVAATLTLLVNDIHRLPDGFNAALPPAYLTATGIAAQVEKRLFDGLVFSAIDGLFPQLRTALSLLGILEQIPTNADPAAHQPNFTLLVVHWERFSTLLRGPAAVFQEVYGWGTPTLNTAKLFDALMDLSLGFLSPAEIRIPSDTFLSAIAPGGIVSATDGPDPMLVVPLAAAGGLSLQLGVLAAPKQTDTELQGLGFHLAGNANFSGSLEIGNDVFFDLQAELDLVAGVGANLRPDVGLTLVSSPDQNPAPFTGGKVIGRVSRRLADGEEPIRLLTIPGGAFIDAQELFVRAGIDATSSADLFVEAGIVKGRFVLPSAGSDSFTRSLLPADGLTVNFDLGLGWSQQKGIFLTAAGGLETLITINATLGPFRIDAIRLTVAADDDGLTMRAGIIGGAALGPLSVTVDALGVQAVLGLSGGNLGPVQLDIGLSAPRGYGIAVDAGSVQGGGFLFFDDTRYSGALELSVFGISVKAFGLIETVLPDGSEGFSFVIVIIAEFTPIQLGFGFTLLGVGGLVGVNRSINEQALADGVRTGSLEHLLFPQNVVQDAPAIINDLATVFPAAKGHFILGPMAKLGWGTPTLITAEVGIILEFPGPRLALLGLVRMVLPSESAAILRLQMAIAGLLDFPAKKVSVDASLFDSTVAGFVVTADMAYRMQLGSNASFLLSVGGFNPGFQPPPPFPTLRRASVDFGINGNPSLVASGYFALTSNTAQIGASIQLHASGFGIHLDGWLGFDVLFVFSPFSFTASISAGVRVSFHGVGFGVTLHGSLSGPNPWHLNGKVCVSVLWWDACLPVDVTFGNNQPASLPEIDPWFGDSDVPVLGLVDAISDARNWAGSDLPSEFTVVTLADASTAERTPIDPLGAATLRQKVAPLNRKLEKFGQYKPKGHDQFSLGPGMGTVLLNEQAVTELEVVEDDFVPDHFMKLTNEQKLSLPSYEPMDAGISVAPNRTALGSSESRVLDYVTKYIDADGTLHDNQPRHRLTQAQLNGLITRSAAALGGVRNAGAEKYILAGRPKKIQLGPRAFVVADACTLVKNASITGTEIPQSQAILALNNHLSLNPQDRGRFAVIPAYTARAA